MSEILIVDLLFHEYTHFILDIISKPQGYNYGNVKSKKSVKLTNKLAENVCNQVSNAVNRVFKKNIPIIKEK